MLQVNENPVRKLNHAAGNEDIQLKEFTDEMNYAKKQVAFRKWNLADYWYHMAEFFHYVGLPADAESHRDKAKLWIQSLPDNGVTKTGYINCGRRDVGIIKSIADCK